MCETLAGLRVAEKAPQVNDIIEQARPIIFNFNYPIFDPNYKKALETKILRHYYFREICETPWNKWQFYLENKMNELMPYYNQLYESTLLKFNPLTNLDYTRSFNRKNDTKETGTLNGENSISQNVENDSTNNVTVNNMRKASDTPQNNLYGVIEDKYLTEFETNDQTSSNTGKDTQNASTDSTNKQDTNNNISTTEEYTEMYSGKNTGDSYSRLLQEYRETMLNIDMMLIKELSPLFFNLY